MLGVKKLIRIFATATPRPVLNHCRVIVMLFIFEFLVYCARILYVLIREITASWSIVIKKVERLDMPVLDTVTACKPAFLVHDR